MPNHTVTHACGHASTYDLAKPVDDRLAWLAAVNCPTCLRLAGDNAAVHLALPPLSGSAWQIQWAESIRAKALVDKRNRPVGLPSDERAAELSAAMGLEVADYLGRMEVVLDAAGAFQLALMAEPTARWWIDNRDSVSGHVMRQVQRVADELFADVRAAERTKKEQADAPDRAEDEARRAAELEQNRIRAAVEAEEHERGAAAAVDFEVAAVEVDGDDVLVHSADGRLARGFIDHLLPLASLFLQVEGRAFCKHNYSSANSGLLHRHGQHWQYGTHSYQRQTLPVARRQRLVQQDRWMRTPGVQSWLGATQRVFATWPQHRLRQAVC